MVIHWQPEKALEDANACVKLEESFVKGHFRKGVALIALERFDEVCSYHARVLMTSNFGRHPQGNAVIVQRQWISPVYNSCMNADTS